MIISATPGVPNFIAANNARLPVVQTKLAVLNVFVKLNRIVGKPLIKFSFVIAVPVAFNLSILFIQVVKILEAFGAYVDKSLASYHNRQPFIFVGRNEGDDEDDGEGEMVSLWLVLVKKMDM